MSSNAKLSKDAKDATAAATTASDAARDGDGSHGRASQAHYTASWRNRDAGNETQAKKHDALAKVHGEKSSLEYQTGDMASRIAQTAEGMSKRAELSDYGSGKGDDADPRSPMELHAAAADAHTKASKAFDLASKPREQAYHADKAALHLAAATKKPD